MADNGCFVTSRDGTRIWAEAAGNTSKPAIVFIHGFSCSGIAFEKQFTDPEMLANLHLIRYDCRGQGRSGQLLEAEGYKSSLMAEDLVAVCEKFNVTKPFLAGAMEECLIAADVCAHYGAEYIAGTIQLAGIPYRSMHNTVAHDIVLEIVPRLLSFDVTTFARACTDFVDSCVSDEFTVPIFMRWSLVGGLAEQAPIARHLLLARTQDEKNFVAAGDKLPMLVIQGTEDKHIYVDKMENFIKVTFPHADFQRLEGVGHMPFYEQSETVNRMILEFITAAKE